MSFSGFTGYQVIQSMKRAYPHLADKLVHLQMAGYTGRQIMGMLQKSKGEKVNIDEMYETPTDFEKTVENQKQNKRQAYKDALSMMGTVGAGAALTLGAYQALKSSYQPNILYTGKAAGIIPKKGLPNKTIKVKNKQIPFKGGKGQKGITKIPFIPPEEGPTVQPSPTPAPLGPKELQSPRAPLQLPHIEAPYAKSVNVVNNLKTNNLFDRVIESGYDIPTSASIIESIIRGSSNKGPLDVFKKMPGGIDKVVEDYSQYLQDQKQQQSYQVAKPKEPYDERVQFQQPPSKINLPGPNVEQQAQPQPIQAPPQQQIGPGRQRLMGIIDKLRGARGENTIAPVQTASPETAIQAPPKETPLEQVPSFPILPPAPKNIPTPAPKKTEKPKAKKSKRKLKSESKLEELKKKRELIKGSSEDAKKKRMFLTKKINELELEQYYKKNPELKSKA